MVYFCAFNAYFSLIIIILIIRKSFLKLILIFHLEKTVFQKKKIII